LSFLELFPVNYSRNPFMKNVSRPRFDKCFVYVDGTILTLSRI
jgi:hypothetical protein